MFAGGISFRCPIPVADLYFLLAGKDSLITQARHYKTVQEMYKKPKPNQDAVCQILDLEFQARRAFIDSAILKEENRLAKIFEAYPCFRELHHVSEALVVFGLSTKLASL